MAVTGVTFSFIGATSSGSITSAMGMNVTFSTMDVTFSTMGVTSSALDVTCSAMGVTYSAMDNQCGLIANLPSVATKILIHFHTFPFGDWSK